jgi:2'-5' RNA ligase
VRLFVALNVSSAVRESLAALMDEFRAVDAKSPGKATRWVRPENLHVTLKFIGEVASEKLEAICGALAEVHCNAAMELRFRGLGSFPDGKRARVIWAGVEASSNVALVAREIDQRLAVLGVAAEKRAYTPHLTLARREPSEIPVELQAAMSRVATRDFGVLQASEFQLIESKLKPTGAEYTTLKSFTFFVDVNGT